MMIIPKLMIANYIDYNYDKNIHTDNNNTIGNKTFSLPFHPKYDLVLYRLHNIDQIGQWENISNYQWNDYRIFNITCSFYIGRTLCACVLVGQCVQMAQVYMIIPFFCVWIMSICFEKCVYLDPSSYFQR